MEQLALWAEPDMLAHFDPLSYDYYIVYFSGGKDSIASLLHLLDCGVPPAKIELHHHLVDGHSKRLMDWPCTEAYCIAFAAAFGVPIHFSWKVDGFRGELLRADRRTMPTQFEDQAGTIHEVGGMRGSVSTRRKFPAVSSDLTKRWCSPYLKIQPAVAAINNQPRFLHKRTLTISGERAQESAGRARYAALEPDAADNRYGVKAVRYIDRWRPVHQWKTIEVWDIIGRYGVKTHPCYDLGWGRCSCIHCIFGSPDQCASARLVDPVGFAELCVLEQECNWTIHDGETLTARADRGNAYHLDPSIVALAMSTVYNLPIRVPQDEWLLPIGAFGEASGPT